MKTILNTKKLKSLSLLLIAFVAAGLVFTSCTKDKNSTLSASVQVSNSAEASLPQDFYMDNNTQASATAVAYGSSSSYLTTTAGNHQAQFKNTGTATTTATLTASFDAGKYYSIFYIDGSSATTVQDDRTAPQTGKARIRFINLNSALSSNVDFGATGGAMLVSNLAFKAASSYYDVDPTTAYSLYATGTTTTLLSIPATIQAGHIYTIYISGATSTALSFHLVTEE